MADPGPVDGPSPAPSANLPGAAGAEVPAPAVGEASVTHGFLFADLRNYTGYVDTHGDRAGASLLARYRALVREAVATAHGAEIRTEGDSFYGVCAGSARWLAGVVTFPLRCVAKIVP